MRRGTSVSAAAAGLLAVFLGTPPTGLAGQEVGESLEQLTDANARLYAQPLTDGLGVAMNAGFAESAAVHQPLGFDFGVRIMGAVVPERRKTFRPVLPDRITYRGREFQDPYAPRPDGPEVTPTAAGAGGGMEVVPQGEFADALDDAGEPREEWTFRFPDGFDVPTIPFVVLQGSLGVGLHTNATVRVVPSVEPSADLGAVRAFGVGGTHELTGWLGPSTPLRVSVTGGYQNFEVADYLEASTTTFSVLVGRGFGPLEVYGIGGRASPTMDVRYQARNPGDNPVAPPNAASVAFSPELAPETRFGLGANFRFLILNVSGEMTFGDYDVASLKAGLSFR